MAHGLGLLLELFPADIRGLAQQRLKKGAQQIDIAVASQRDRNAVQLATARAHAGDAVLMSPACASFDMFTGYEHRAQVFCAAVQALADDAGQALEGQS